MNSALDVLGRFQHWYSSMCNGDWEHTYGIFIGNIDNPGWSLKIELSDTYLQERDFGEINIQRDDDNNWMICKKTGSDFQAYCGPNNLSECLEIFLEWSHTQDTHLKKQQN